jgi:hypothetical protein
MNMDNPLDNTNMSDHDLIVTLVSDIRRVREDIQAPIYDWSSKRSFCTKYNQPI